MATRVYDNNPSDSGINMPPIPINEVPIGGRRGGTVVSTDIYDKGNTPSPNRNGSAEAPTEVIDYSQLGMLKDGTKPASAEEEKDTRTKVFFGSSSKPAAAAPATSAPAAAEESAEIDPCVGWIAVISGPMKGRTFELQAGQNHIGRDSSNNIILSQDPGISRKSHVIITYYHRHNMFNVCRGTEGRGTADLNNQPLEMPTQLHSGDEILLTDDTTLRFVPLCCENFKW